MTQNLAKYHGRAPRYILNTEDDSLIRIAGPKQTPWEEGTQIRNVSLTGLAFTAPSDLCPILGEVIKIQFFAPGGQQMASYAIVTRIDSLNEFESLVAVHFYKMEMGHRITLAQGLAKKLKDQSELNQKSSWQEEFSTESISRFFIAASFLGLWSQLFFLIIHYRYEGLLNLFLNK